MIGKLIVILAIATMCHAIGRASTKRISFRTNTQLMNHQIGIFNTSRHLSCARLCFSLISCKSINFVPADNKCKLNDADSVSADQLEFAFAPGFVYSDIRSWPMDIAGGCRFHNCPYYQSCFPTGNSFICKDIECTDPPRIEFGFVNGKSTHYGADLSIDCQPGYELKGPTFITCYVNGQWSEPPVCNPVDCGNPYNDTDNYNGLTTYGTTIEYMCGNGHVTNGSSTITCEASGNWSVVACVPKDCGDPGILNGVYDANFTTYGWIIEVTCGVGYDLDGMTSVQCLETGNWSTLPECVIVDCRYPKITNGKASGMNTTYTSTLNVSCNDGYFLLGEPSIVCQSNGAWSEFPECAQVECVEGACFQLHSGIQLTPQGICNANFASNISSVQSCIVHCFETKPSFVSVNYNSDDFYCRCFVCTLEEYENSGFVYATNSPYNLYEMIP